MKHSKRKRVRKPTAKVVHPYDVFGGIIAYEQDGLDYEGMLELFQHLINTGLAWTLQGHYGRTAMQLLRCGDIALPSMVCRKCGASFTPIGIDTIHRSCTGYLEYARHAGLLK